MSPQTGSEAPIRTFTLSLVGAAALVAGIFVFRQQRPTLKADAPPAGEDQTRVLDLERIRELGV